MLFSYEIPLFFANKKNRKYVLLSEFIKSAKVFLSIVLMKLLAKFNIVTIISLAANRDQPIGGTMTTTTYPDLEPKIGIFDKS